MEPKGAALMKTVPIEVSAREIPEFAELLRATHVLLVKRLLGELQTPDGLRAWNDLISAHDAIAEKFDNG